MNKKTYTLIICILGPYLVGVIGNASFSIFQWAEFSRWVLALISLASFTGVFADMDNNTPKKEYK